MIRQDQSNRARDIASSALVDRGVNWEGVRPRNPGNSTVNAAMMLASQHLAMRDPEKSGRALWHVKKKNQSRAFVDDALHFSHRRLRAKGSRLMTISQTRLPNIWYLPLSLIARSPLICCAESSCFVSSQSCVANLHMLRNAIRNPWCAPFFLKKITRPPENVFWQNPIPACLASDIHAH
jgi:hypothetical protein